MPHLTIQSDQNHKRIDVLCAELFSEHSRSQWQKHGRFKQNNLEKPGRTKVKTDETWEVSFSQENTATQNLVPWDHTLKILVETNDYLALDKPRGISVHPSLTDPSQQTIVNALIHYLGQDNLSENYDDIDGHQIPRPGLVHRLDKETSGVLLVAKNNKFHQYITENWSQTQKFYHATVSGQPPLKARIEAGIMRDPVHRQKMCASQSDQAKDALTTFERLKQSPDKALLKLQIHTGRTHQIRVHLSSIGFPVIGDTLYGGEPAERMMLHASDLIFTDMGGTPQHIQSPYPTIFTP